MIYIHLKKTQKNFISKINEIYNLLIIKKGINIYNLLPGDSYLLKIELNNKKANSFKLLLF